MEGLAAFFLESVFLGVWLFGWGVLPKRVHLFTVWMIPVGAFLSALFIIAANSWMQNPRGYTINPTTGRAELTSIGDVFTNPVFLWGYAHVLMVALIFGGAVMLAVSAWHLRRGNDVQLFRGTAKLGLFVLVVASVLQFPIGGRLGINETTYQPMKIAAAEANWDTCQPCSFSVIQIGGYNQDETPTKIIEIPHLLSVLATGTWDGQVLGLSEVNEQYNQQYGPGYYVPNVFIQYWGMRAMAYLALVGAAVGRVGRGSVVAQEVRDLPVLPVGVHLADPGAVRDGHRGVAAHRERPAAVDRAGPDAHRGRAVRVGQRHPGRRSVWAS